MKKKRDIEGNRLLHFELSDKNRTVRWVLIVILLVIAAVSVTIGLTRGLETPAGWQTVSGSTTGLNCGEDFILRYEYGAGDASATAESKALEQLYGKTLEEAWKLFFNEAGATDWKGIFEINQHPNEEITVADGLYKALEQMVSSGSRVLYLAPIYAEYDRVFFSENDAAAKESDPGQNEEQRSYVQTLADYARDPQMIQLVLSAGNKVKLQVSQEYLSFAKQNEVRNLVDFGWLRNAFIADYIAGVLTANGFTNGYIDRTDGFTRNLDQRGNQYGLNLFNRNGDSAEMAAVMNYTGQKSLVFLRGYPLYDQESDWYYI